MNNKSVFAPIIIPTLCRYEHFKRCLESLENCSLANETDVFVGLDYPPNDSYKDGWQKIDTYLTMKEQTNGFKSLTVFRRDYNCGVGHSMSNDALLLDYVRENYDTYIFTEDDNEFAPSFLEYINWGLKQYRNDQSVYAICGFNRMDLPFLKNNIYRLNTKYVAWGYGSWSDRLDKFINMRDRAKLYAYLENMSAYDMLFEQIKTASSIVTMLRDNKYLGDCIVRTIPKEERYCIFPKDHLVRNWGTDGSGVNGGNAKENEMYTMMNLDSKLHFTPICEFDMDDEKVFREWKRTYPIPLKITIFRIINIFRYLLYDRFFLKYDFDTGIRC